MADPQNALVLQGGNVIVKAVGTTVVFQTVGSMDAVLTPDEQTELAEWLDDAILAAALVADEEDDDA
jgi:hypothetical protein